MRSGDLIVARPVLIAEDCCGRCKHMHEVFGPQGPTLYCRRLPPVPFPEIVMTEGGPSQAGTVSNFPSVLTDMVCGEFKRRVYHGKASPG